MESVPAVFAGVSFAVFGGALLLWSTRCMLLRRPVAEGAHPVAGAVIALVTAVLALAAGIVLLPFW